MKKFFLLALMLLALPLQAEDGIWPAVGFSSVGYGGYLMLCHEGHKPVVGNDLLKFGIILASAVPELEIWTWKPESHWKPGEKWAELGACVGLSAAICFGWDVVYPVCDGKTIGVGVKL